MKILNLNQNQFSGEIPPELGLLTELQSLDLSSNSLAGEIPPEIGKLTKLRSLGFGNNFFNGTINGNIFLHLKKLRFLDIANNSISGELPPEIGDLENLTDLFIGINQFSGEIPHEIGKLVKLENFYSPSCFFKGPLPREIGHLKMLSKLDLSYNPLKCEIPKSIGKLRNLEILNLVYSGLNGSIPKELGQCRKLKSLVLSFNSLSGSLPYEMFDLPLLSFSAEKNHFSGDLPKWVGKWGEINSILLSGNRFTGRIPVEIGNCSMLNVIDLESNMISGSLEDTFVKCGNVSQLILADNKIVGSIPGYFSELPLMVLDLDSNNLTGSIPLSLWKSTNLLEFSAANNMLEGNLIPEIGNSVMLERLILSNNLLTGEIPKDIGKLTSLSVLNLNSNQFSGSIPAEIGDCVSLTTLDLGDNGLNGSIPEKITRLPELQCLVLSNNELTGSIPGSEKSKYFRQVGIPDSSFVQHHGLYDLSYNRLTGLIPDDIGDCLVVVDLLLNGNTLLGEIPKSLAKLTNLTTLDLSSNLLSGGIPMEIGGNSKLQGLFLEYNNLTGPIPFELGQLTGLVKLNITGNKLSGSIPVMNLSYNSFMGELPRSLGNMSYLNSLDLHGNRFTGTIPADLGNLIELEHLDISNNNLSGRIPDKLCGILNLNFVNLAGNQLEGPVPRNGICTNVSILSLSGNKDLCGRILGMECPDQRFEKRSRFLNVWVLTSIVIGMLLVTVFVMAKIWMNKMKKRDDCERVNDIKMSSNSALDQNLYLLGSSRSKEPLSINIAMFEQPLLKLTLADILEATNNFCKSNIVGDGGFGTVYKARLPDGKTVAIKKLNKSKSQGQREFLAEMETLGKVKHRNLVPLLGYCSYDDEKLLVYEYMVNGSLDLWLRNQTGPTGLGILSWTTRFKIAVGAARGLAFLHHVVEPHIIHRDIKASNILLNEDFEAKVADFGLARLISACETHVSTDLAGTFGYIPPEYGQSWRSTTRGDVYSFGVILLELATGKEPTGLEFKDIEGGNLVGWVSEKIKKGRIVDVLDPTVVTANSNSKQAMLKTVQIATDCLSENPISRPNMFHVLNVLKAIKKEFL
ncbi:leucine-rich repeat receptor protein kinase EMS1 [Tanacetum coccineum]